jgi:peroxiredoxin
MRYHGRWTILVAALILGPSVGCKDTSQPGPTAPSEPAGPKPAQVQPAKPETPPEEPPPPPTIPEVLLPDALRETCIVAVGDPMPDARLRDLAGEEHSLGDLRGEKLTVVFFWTRGSSEFSAIAAQTQLEDLQQDVYEPYEQKGVRVIAVNEGNDPESVRKLVEQAAVGYPVLLDADGALFAKVATEELPRAYLLDAEGKILWFDLEYSETTRANLMQAIQVALGETGEPATAAESDSSNR